MKSLKVELGTQLLFGTFAQFANLELAEFVAARLGPLISDPFIPENIRHAVLELIRGRLTIMGEIYHAAFEKYSNGLAKGRQEPVTDLDGINKIHNADNTALSAVCLGAARGDVLIGESNPSILVPGVSR